ncbi:hypothetical protein RRF57_010716 [Xylaria bambusicola]|uniref:Uncharacterized protein n=1 Tax=Xylaria bambusicola TaxID=326684 RepID=A0AAN7UVF3_9PEZI
MEPKVLFIVPVDFTEFVDETGVDDRIIKLLLLLPFAACVRPRVQSRHFPVTGLVALRTLQPSRPGGTFGGLAGRKTVSLSSWSSSAPHLLAT